MAAKLHLAENALALHLLLQSLQGLINIVVTNENLHASSSQIDLMGQSPRSGPMIGRACSRNAGEVHACGRKY